MLLRHGVQLYPFRRSSLSTPEMPGEEIIPFSYECSPFQAFPTGSSGLQQVWDTLRALLDYEDEPATLIPAFDENYLVYYGGRGLLRWTPKRMEYQFRPQRKIEPKFVCDELVLLFNAIERDSTLFSVRSPWTTFLLKRMRQEIFSATCENNATLLEAVFLLKPGEINFIDLSKRAADSEIIGQDWCLLLQECGLDAEAYVSKMLNLNNGQDVYLEPLDCRDRGVAVRRLKRGNWSSSPSLRWEWAVPPKENPNTVLEVFTAFSRAYELDNGRQGLFWVHEWQWPFCDDDLSDPDVEKIVLRRALRAKQGRKPKKQRQIDRLNMHINNMPGTFPD